MELVRKTGVIGKVFVLMFVFALVATACDSDDTATTTTAASPETTAATDTEAPGTTAAAATTTAAPPETTEAPAAGVTRLVFAVPPPELGEGNNPNRDVNPNDEWQIKPIYENLVWVNPENAAWEPMLAESWGFNEAGDELTFNIRQGVQCHNGFGEFTARDVVFSLTDAIEPVGAVSEVAEKVRSAVTEFEIVDDYTVTFHVTPTTPEAFGLGFAFFEGISYGATGAALKCMADWEARGGGSTTPTLDEAPFAGTGPYQFLERTPGQNVVFERVPYDHWRKNGSFQEIEYRYISENSTRLAALLAGEVHVTELPPELGVEAVNQGMAVIKSSLPGRRYGLHLPGCYYVETNSGGQTPGNTVFVSGEYRDNNSPWCNRDARIAANKAIDRQALIDAFFPGAEPAIMWYWLPEQTETWNPEWETRFDELYGYNPEEAIEYLALAGYAPGELQVRIFDRGDITEAIAQMLEEAGFDVEIISMDPAQWTEMREAREIHNGVEFDDTASENITGYEAKGYGNDGSGRNHEDVEHMTLYEAILYEVDPEVINPLWAEFGNIIFDFVEAVPLFRTFTEYSVNPEVVCDYTFPGAGMTSRYSFVEYIEACDS